MEQRRKVKTRVRVRSQAEVEWQQREWKQRWFAKLKTFFFWTALALAALAFMWYVLGLVNAPPRPIPRVGG
jgi:hypothetical protein